MAAPQAYLWLHKTLMICDKPSCSLNPLRRGKGDADSGRVFDTAQLKQELEERRRHNRKFLMSSTSKFNR